MSNDVIDEAVEAKADPRRKSLDEFKARRAAVRAETEPEWLPEELKKQYLWHLEQQNIATAEEQQAQQLMQAVSTRRAGMQSFIGYLRDVCGYPDGTTIDAQGRITRA